MANRPTPPEAPVIGFAPAQDRWSHPEHPRAARPAVGSAAASANERPSGSSRDPRRRDRHMLRPGLAPPDPDDPSAYPQAVVDVRPQDACEVPTWAPTVGCGPKHP